MSTVDNPPPNLLPQKEIESIPPRLYVVALSINPHVFPEQFDVGDLQPVTLFAFDTRDPDDLPLLRPLTRLPIHQERVTQALAAHTPITELFESEPYMALTHPDMSAGMQSYLERELGADSTEFRFPAFSEISDIFDPAQRHDIGYHLLRKAHNPDFNQQHPALTQVLENTASMFLYSTGVTRHIPKSQQERFETKYHGQFAADFGDFPVEPNDLITVRERIVELIEDAKKSLSTQPSVKIMQDLEDMSELWGEAFLYALERHARAGGKTEIIIPPGRIHPQAYPINTVMWPVQCNTTA